MNVAKTARERWGDGLLIVGIAVAAALLILIFALFLLPATASADSADPRQPVTLAVAGPADVPLGNQARIIAALRDNGGKPIAKVPIVFSSPASFAGTISEMKIGEILTDAEGAVTFDYQLRIQGENQVIARFYGDDQYQPAEARTIIMATGTAQLTQRSAGVDVPLLGPGTLVVILAVVWATYFTALVLVAGIAGTGKPGTGLETGGK